MPGRWGQAERSGTPPLFSDRTSMVARRVVEALLNPRDCYVIAGWKSTAYTTLNMSDKSLIFLQEGVDGLLRDKTRPPGKAPLLAETVRARHRCLRLRPPTGREPPPARTGSDAGQGRRRLGVVAARV